MPVHRLHVPRDGPVTELSDRDLNRMACLHAGVVQAEGDPRGDHVLRERANQDQQVSLPCPSTESVQIFSVF